MKYIKEKLVKNKKYYYFNYTLLQVFNKKKIYLSKYIGIKIPDNIKDLMLDFFQKNIAQTSLQKISQSIKDYFPYNTSIYIEKNRFWYTCLLHKTFNKDFKLFRTLFYILFVLNSNRAEGSRVVRPDIEKVLQKRKVKPKTSIDKEIINSVEAINFAFSKKMQWNIKSIKTIHYKLFYNIAPNTAGQYKKEPNLAGDNIRGGIVSTTLPKDVSKEMRNLINWLNQERKKKTYPPILALEFHWRFEAVHPFQDGNGRVGRILLNALLVENNFMPVIFFSKNHQSYCSAISKARTGYSKKLAQHFVEHLKKTKINIEKYEKEKVIKIASPQTEKWERARANTKIY